MTTTSRMHQIRWVETISMRPSRQWRPTSMPQPRYAVSTFLRNHPLMRQQQQQDRMSFIGAGSQRCLCLGTLQQPNHLKQTFSITPQQYYQKLSPRLTLTLSAAASSLATKFDVPSPTTNQDTTEIHNQRKDSSVKKSGGKKRGTPPPPPSSSSSTPKLLQLRDPVPRDIIEQSFEDIALQTELVKLKLFAKLKNKLLLAKRKETGTATVKSSPLWAMTQDFLDRQKTLPDGVKAGFWNLILAPTSSSLSQNATTERRNAPTKVVSPKHIEILINAREVAVHRPIFWNDKHKHQVLKQIVKDKKQHRSALPEYQTKRSQQLLQIHEAKSQQQRLEEATALAQHLASKLPPTQYKKLCRTLQDFATEYPIGSTQSPSSTQRKNSRYGIYETYSLPLHATAKEHIHLVAEPLVHFFYLTVDATATDTSTTRTIVDVLKYDPKIESKVDNWNQAKEEFITAFQTIQGLLIEEHEQSSSVKHDSGAVADDQLLSADDIDRIEKDDHDDLNRPLLDEPDELSSDDDYDDDDDEDEEEEIDDDMIDDDDAEADRTYDDSDESVTETFREVSRILPIEKEKKKVTTKGRRYIAFEAISIAGVPSVGSELVPQEVDKSSRTPPSVFPPPTDRLIFIDNLPIDVTEDALRRAYSRCGPIESIQIFHQRPDLDPGRKSGDSKKKIRKPSSVRSLWERPRTPLYATILYSNADGARKATVDSLRIFGMVLDKHLIRSYTASSMTNLYIEDMPTEHDITSVEAKLSQVLHPNLYVCLDVEQRRQKRYHGPSSCVVRFPDFASAFWAYAELSSELPCLKANDECQLHWMPTPGDAELYWTRKLNY